MRAERVTAEALASGDRDGLAGAVLLAPVRLGAELIAKGTRLDTEASRQLHEAAQGGRLPASLRLAWPDPGDLHEDDAAAALAGAIAGPGVARGAPRQSRVDLTARTDGVLRVQVEALARLNRVDPLEVFTLFHGQAVRAGQVVASAKVAPHLVAGHAVAAGMAVARASAPLVDVAPYLPLPVAAIAAEPLATGALERFAGAARAKVEGLGGTFVGCYPAARRPGDTDEAMGLGAVLDDLGARGVRILLVGGVSAGDPLAPMFEALAARGGAVVRRGVPAHPGSMIWFGRLGGATLMGLPQCGMFSMATAADLVLPRLLTGEMITADALADLGHGGLLGREMRFRLPDYARELETPADP
ncbi:MAG: hypothetical protein IPI92_09030 [Gemmatimonadetes bacterium]|nr:hypothetical protein [Gemmatimonadota bacterium]